MSQQLEALGVKVKRTYKSSSSSVNGMELSQHHTTEFAMQLPKVTALKVHFTKEGLGKKIAKLFKKELQTGDADFDRAVFIATDTPDDTAKFLEAESVRQAIALAVGFGGYCDVDGDKVVIEVEGRQDGDDASVTAIVTALLA